MTNHETFKNELRSKVEVMVKLQDKMNAMTNDDWINAGFDWRFYGLNEAFEAIGHLGYKHWKETLPAVAQTRLEVVDMLHFFISDVIVTFKGDIEKVVDYVLDALRPFDIDKFNQDVRVTPPTAEDVKRLNGIFRKYEETLAVGMRWTAVLPLLGMDHNMLYQMYMAKNVLNQFRQRNGYKEGTYIKIWFGEEDNVHLERILDVVKFGGDVDQFLDVVNDNLQAIYDNVKLQQISDAS